MTAESLSAPLARLDRMLARAVDEAAGAAGSEARPDPFRGLYISDEDALRASRDPRAPACGAAAVEPPLADLVEPGSPLAALAARHRLSSFDLDLLVIALAPEIDLRYERLYAFLQDDVSRRRPSVDLALNLLCASSHEKLARREHFATDAPLVREGLIELIPEPGDERPSVLAHGLRVDDAALRRLLGLGGLDWRLRPMCTLVEADAPRRSEADPALAALVALAQAGAGPLVVYFSGPATAGKRDSAHALAAAAGAPLLALDLAYALDADARLEQTLTLLPREAALHRAVLFAEDLDAIREPEAAVLLRRLIDAVARHRGATVLAGRRADPPRGDGLQGVVHVPFALPARAERRRSWREALAAAGIDVPAETLDRIAARYGLTRDQIGDAVAVARNRARLAGREPTADDLLTAARTRTDIAPSGLVRKIEPVHEWGDLVLPDDVVAQLRELCGRIVERPRVLEEWAFGRRHVSGTGVNALFAGPSGTGKTTAAEIVAGELGLDLLKIDLSGVVSKYIGETEKNLRHVFSTAETANAMLFFDEADALFGKRSEVRDSHDRYANIEIAYLLERMERYQGVAVLATNLRQNMDDAFVRRLQFVVEFPFPSEEERARIWALQFPPEAELAADVDLAALARQFRVTGGSITNIAQAAAFLAAGAGGPIGMPELMHAARREYQKLGHVMAVCEAVAS